MEIVILGFGVLVLAGIPYATYLLMWISIAPKGSPAAKTETTEPVTILLPTYNEAEIITETLTSLTEIDYPHEQMEVVIVDASTDETPELIREFSASHDTPSITLIEEDSRGGVATAVNTGVDAAIHDIIFRTDCDARLAPSVIRHAVANLQDEHVAGVTGRQTAVLGDSKVEGSYRSMQARNQSLESHLDSTFIVHGPCFAFERERFEPLASGTIADDTEIAVTIRRSGARVVMDPAMHFVEPGVSDIRQRRQKKDRRALGLLQTLVANRDMVGRYGTYGRVILPTNWWFLAISPWLVLLGTIVIIVGAFLAVGLYAIALLVVLAVFVMLGHRDALGPGQALYTVFDAHLSLLIASSRLMTGRGGDGIWEQDDAARELMGAEE